MLALSLLTGITVHVCHAVVVSQVPWFQEGCRLQKSCLTTGSPEHCRAFCRTFQFGDPNFKSEAFALPKLPKLLR